MSVSPPPLRLNIRSTIALKIIYRLHRWRARLPMHCTRRRRLAMSASRIVGKLLGAGR